MESTKTTDSAGDNGATVVEATATDALRVGSVLSDRYRLDAELGRGAMGAVFKAEHTLMRKTVAIKVLHADTRADPASVARFQREAQAVAQIDHPNVCAATDFGVAASGERFLVMEHVAGRDLATVLEQEGRLEPLRAVAIFRQIASALARCHGLGIVHRDLKPENVMLVARPDGGGAPQDLVKLLDFGIAAIEQSELGAGGPKLTAVGMTLGTPHYMSPEQATASELDGRSDLYSVGVMLFEALTGRAPFDHDDNVQLLTMHVRQPPPTLASFSDGLPGGAPPPALERIVARLLEKVPEARYATAAELEQDLARAAASLGAAPSSAPGADGAARAPEAPLATGAPAGGSPAPSPATSPATPPHHRALPPLGLLIGVALAVGALVVGLSFALGEGPPDGDGAPAAGATPAASSAAKARRGAAAQGLAPDETPPLGVDERGLTVLEHVVARHMSGRQPEGVAQLFGPDTTKVYCHVVLANRRGPRRKLSLVWYHQGQEHYRFPIKVGQSPQWRTYGVMRIKPDKVGAWRCDVVNEQDVVLSSALFAVGAGL
jgi:tRNA A-37 threonylcarbamoyl transferase component Bud32